MKNLFKGKDIDLRAKALLSWMLSTIYWWDGWKNKNISIKRTFCNLPTINFYIKRRVWNYMGNIVRQDQDHLPKKLLGASIRCPRKLGQLLNPAEISQYQHWEWCCLRWVNIESSAISLSLQKTKANGQKSWSRTKKQLWPKLTMMMKARNLKLMPLLYHKKM